MESGLESERFLIWPRRIHLSAREDQNLEGRVQTHTYRGGGGGANTHIRTHTSVSDRAFYAVGGG